MTYIYAFSWYENLDKKLHCTVHDLKFLTNLIKFHEFSWPGKCKLNAMGNAKYCHY